MSWTSSCGIDYYHTRIVRYVLLGFGRKFMTCLFKKDIFEATQPAESLQMLRNHIWFLPEYLSGLYQSYDRYVGSEATLDRKWRKGTSTPPSISQMLVSFSNSSQVLTPSICPSIGAVKIRRRSESGPRHLPRILRRDRIVRACVVNAERVMNLWAYSSKSNLVLMRWSASLSSSFCLCFH